MKPKLKTKTVIDVLQSLRLIPSFTAQFSGDVLPEAVLLKNILEEMMSNITTLSGLHSMFNQKKDLPVAFSDKEGNERLIQAIRKFHSSILELQTGKNDEAVVEDDSETRPEVKDYDYDADTEADNKSSSRRAIRKRVSSSTKNDSEPTRGRIVTRGSTRSLKTDGFNDREDPLIRDARTLLLLIQTDTNYAAQLAKVLSNVVRDGSIVLFNETLAEFEAYAVNSIGVPYETKIQEVEALCGSIFMTQKFDKSIRKMKVTLDEVEESSHFEMAKKVEEKAELQKTGDDIRQLSRHVIRNIRRTVGERVRVMAWKSHARQFKIGEEADKLKSELETSTTEHVSIENALRHENNILEQEIQGMIDQYDKEMFRNHHDIKRISEEYARERVELEEALKTLDEVNMRKEALMEEMRLEEEADRAVVLLRIRKNVAAKTIQRSWRAHKTRMLLKGKKKKKKKNLAN